MPRNRYCFIENCEYFKGTSDKNVHMFRIPIDPRENELWLKAINDNSKSHIPNCSGWICNLHFQLTDIEKVNGKLKLKNGTVPEIFARECNKKTDERKDTNHNQQNNKCIDCESCETCTQKLNQMRNEYKCAQLKLRLNHEIVQYKKNDQINALKKEIFDKCEKLDALKERNTFLGKLNRQYEREIKSLREKMLCRNDASSAKDVRQKEILQCLAAGMLPLEKYPESVRKFTLSMHYHSPRAYEYLRQSFDNHLPHASTIQRWYANSNMDSPPGITGVSIEFLKKKVAEKKATGEELVVAVCFDEMSIRKQVVWSQSARHMLGYVSYGCSNDDDDRMIAKEAIVFIVSGINEKFRVPVCYHFVNSMDAEKKTELVVETLKAIDSTGAVITSLTFDGHSTNKKMCKILGINLIACTSPYFMLNENKIFIFFDICHCEKLVRKHFDNKQILINENGQKIKWDYIVQLVRFSQQHGFSIMHKLNQCHLEWKRKPMNVRLAVETMSTKTADSLDFLAANGHKEFADVAGTSDFIRYLDALFDIFNSKSDNINENLFKNPISPMNKDEIFGFFKRAIKYMFKLKFVDEAGEVKYICKSPAKTGFVGFIIGMRSLELMYTELVEDKKIISEIPTYNLNQDAVEIFFSKMRARGGCNDNPNVVHFHAAYRKLLANASVLISKSSNCTQFEIDEDPFTDVMFISSRRAKSHQLNEEEVEYVVSEEVEVLYQKLAALSESSKSHLTDDLEYYTINFIASIVEKKIASSGNCDKCANVFKICKKVPKAFNSSKPCVSTYNICKETNQFLNLQLLKGDIHFETIYYSILNNIDLDNMYKEEDFIQHPDHKLYLIRTVVDGFIAIKGPFMAKTATKDLHSKLFRQKFRKLLHHYGQ